MLLSGGHTLLVLVRNLSDYIVLGSTLDDSVGEAIDKAARYINLPWKKGENGGLAASFVDAAERARKRFDHNYTPCNFSIPSSNRIKTSLDFSFAGLKSEFKRKFDELTSSGVPNFLEQQDTVDVLAMSFLDACSQHISDRLNNAMRRLSVDDCYAETPVIISGGVARNSYLVSRYITF